MNSLEFIKMHVDEWPSTDRHKLTHCILLSYGILAYGTPMGVGRINPYEHIDLSEHFAPDYYDGKLWTREDFESFGNGDSSSIEWEGADVCYAESKQWFSYKRNDKSLIRSCGSVIKSMHLLIDVPDFQLNEIQQGDCILVDEIDDEDKYNDAVEVFGLFGFKKINDIVNGKNIHNSEFTVTYASNASMLLHVKPDHPELYRKISYNQLMVIGKLKRLMNERDKKNTLWSPTINSIVDVGDCEGVVRAIDGEHCWVVKDTGMYDTYHKDSLKQPVGGDIKAVMEATWFTKAAAETLIDGLDMVGYKIARKETSE